jgi:hypothetical protein
MRRSLVHVVCQGLFVVMTASLLAGCQKGGVKAGSGPPPPTAVRHDLPDLVKRFPTLIDPVSAAWVTWGDDTGGAPEGWNVEYLDAVVHLPSSSTQALVSVTRPTDTGRKPSVQTILSSEIPGGPYLTGDGLDRAFSSANASSYAYLDRGRNVLVLQSTGVND